MSIEIKDWTDVKITRSLLEKNSNELTDVENEAIKFYKERIKREEDNMKRSNKEINENCPKLCSGYDSYFVVSPGWTEPIENFCYQIESLNIDYAKYGLKVISSQNKSKYGEYRCYYDIYSEPTGVLKFPIKIIESIGNLLDKVDYKKKYVIVEPSYVTIEFEEISENDFNEKMIRGRKSKRFLIWNDNEFSIGNRVKHWKNYAGDDMCEKISFISHKISDKECDEELDLHDVDVFKSENGKFFYAYELHHSLKNKMIVTKHKAIFKINNVLKSFSFWMKKFVKTSNVKYVKMRDLEAKVSKLYDICQKECSDHCEYCGEQFDDRFEPMCITHGWIANLCERCADASGNMYDKNGETWQNGSRVTREDIKE